MGFLDALVDPALVIPRNPQPSGKPQLANRNNNPGNLRYAKQKQATRGDLGFARFEDAAAGAQALYDQVVLDGGRGSTLGAFVRKYAPPHENDTKKYTARMTAALNAPETARLADVDPDAVMRFVAKQESGTDLSGFTPRRALPAMGGNPAPVRADAVDQPTTPKTKSWLRTLVPAIDAVKVLKARADSAAEEDSRKALEAWRPPEQTIGPRSSNADVKYPGMLSSAMEAVSNLVDRDGIRTQHLGGLEAAQDPEVAEQVMMSGSPMLRTGTLRRAFSLNDLNRMKNWALVTAENVGGRAMPQALNDAAMLPFENRAARLALPFQKTVGQYPSGAGQLITNETSLLFPDMSENTARALARGAGQESALVKRGYLNTTGALNPTAGLRRATSQDQAFFEVANGPDGPLTSDIDWERSIAPKPMVLDHYSPVDKLTGTDVRFQGTGRAGEEVNRPRRPKMTHFYRGGAKPERMFNNDHMYTTETDLPFLDLESDPDNMAGRIMDAWRKEGLTRGTPAGDYLERMLKKLGYAGYMQGDIVKSFENLPLKQLRSVLATALGGGAVAEASTQKKAP